MKTPKIPTPRQFCNWSVVVPCTARGHVLEECHTEEGYSYHMAVAGQEHRSRERMVGSGARPLDADAVICVYLAYVQGKHLGAQKALDHTREAYRGVPRHLRRRGVDMNPLGGVTAWLIKRLWRGRGYCGEVSFRGCVCCAYYRRFCDHPEHGKRRMAK